MLPFFLNTLQKNSLIFFFLIIVPLRGYVLPQLLENISFNIIKHVENVSYESIKINRIVINFKIDEENKVWLLGCSSLRLNKDLLPFQKLHSNLTPVYEPTNLIIEVFFPSLHPRFLLLLIFLLPLPPLVSLLLFISFSSISSSSFFSFCLWFFFSSNFPLFFIFRFQRKLKILVWLYRTPLLW